MYAEHELYHKNQTFMKNIRTESNILPQKVILLLHMKRVTSLYYFSPKK